MSKPILRRFKRVFWVQVYKSIGRGAKMRQRAKNSEIKVFYLLLVLCTCVRMRYVTLLHIQPLYIICINICIYGYIKRINILTFWLPQKKVTFLRNFFTLIFNKLQQKSKKSLQNIWRIEKVVITLLSQLRD